MGGVGNSKTQGEREESRNPALQPYTLLQNKGWVGEWHNCCVAEVRLVIKAEAHPHEQSNACCSSLRS